MKSLVSIIIFWLILSGLSAQAQISRQLQDAINNVPVAKFDYPANRNRNIPPQVASPQAFAFAYYRLPYAVNLNLVYNSAINSYVEIVMLDFDSVDLSVSEERQMVRSALIQLQDLMDKQGRIARLAGFMDYTNFSNSYISQFSTNGNAIIAIRELMSSQILFNTLVGRANSL